MQFNGCRRVLGQFLPRGPPNIPDSNVSAFHKIAKKKTETAMYSPLIKALAPFCVNMQLVDTHVTPDPQSGDFNPDLLKPNIAVYKAKDIVDPITQFSPMETHVELKLAAMDDAFSDEGALEPDSETPWRYTHRLGPLSIGRQSHQRIRICGMNRTWQFISAKLLLDPAAPRTITDELESFLHVLMWVTIVFTPTAMSPVRLASILQLRYHEVWGDPQEPMGGLGKRTAIEGGMTSVKVFKLASTNLDELLSPLYPSFGA
ncbi:hypothetical protein IW262DRAFT_1395089 [Armillaria fumosa]|nr:hypothetical protein IW262DRAFT_1395089 [Armillaria fumosa]